MTFALHFEVGIDMCSHLAQKQLSRISSCYLLHATNLMHSPLWNFGLPTYYVIFFPVVLVDILLFLFVKIVATGNVATDLEYWSGIGSRNVGCIKYDLVAMGNVATDLEYWSGIGSGNVGCIKYDWDQCLSDGILWKSRVARSEVRFLQKVLFF